MRNVYAALLMAIAASFPMSVPAGTPSYSVFDFDQPDMVAPLHGEADSGVPTLRGSVVTTPPNSAELTEETFRFGSHQAANDRRGLGPRVRAQESKCRGRVAEIRDSRPLKQGRLCIG
jgi:hypothetical protein